MALVALAGGVAQDAFAAGPWVDAAGLLQGRYDHSATLLGNGKVLVMGGASTTFVASPELYDPSAKTWTATGGLTSSSGRQRHTATLLQNGKVLVAGGHTSGGTTSTTRSYDPATNVWSVGPNMVSARYGHTATLLPSGKVMVVGGFGPVGSAELYDPIANSWSLAASPKVARHQHAATLLENGKVLVTGGTGGDSTSAELYDPATNSWSDAAAMPSGRSNHSSTLLANGMVLVAGGQDGTTLQTASLYNPATNGWSAAASMAAPRYLHTATLLPSGEVLVVGGFNVSPTIWSSAELYDPASNRWSSGGGLASARVRHTATLLPDGQVLVAGGYTGAAVGSSTSFIGSVETFEAAAPVVTVPADITAEATGPGGAAVSWSGVAASDLVDGPLNASCAPASGSTFTLGTHTLTCSATDAHGNTGSASFSVQVVDTTAPVVTVPADITAEVTGPAVVFVTWGGVSASDLVDGPIASTCDASPGRFAVGDHTVTCSATDTHGNTGSASFLVRVVDTTPPVVDTTPPVVTIPADITAEATGSAGAAVSWSGVSASDLVDGPLNASCAPASGSTFTLGTHTVTCSATDAHGNTGSASFSVQVVDTTAPVVTVPADSTAEASGPGGAAVSWSGVSASDLVDGALDASCARASGSMFAVGTDTVTCSATDADGNTGRASFQVTVRDTTAPGLTLPADISVDATSAAGAVVTYITSATDLVDGAVTVTCSPATNSIFPIGTTTVACAASDSNGNQAQRSFTVTVRGAGALLDELASDASVRSVKSLSQKIADAKARYAANNIAGTCSKLADFIKEVSKQSGKQLTIAKANELIAKANSVRSILGC